MRLSTILAAALIAAGLSAPALAAANRTAGAETWQTMQDRKACHTLGTEFSEAAAQSRGANALGHADSLAATATNDCNTGRYHAGRLAFDEALAVLGVTPMPSWGDSAD